jgi:hypothetical protein
MTDSSVGLKSQDFAVQDSDGETLGTLRIRPSHLWWRPADATKWRRIAFGRVTKLVEAEGEDVDAKPGQLPNGRSLSSPAS